MGIYALTLLFMGVMTIGLIFSRLDMTRPKMLILFLLTFAVFIGLFFSIHHHIYQTCAVLEGESLKDIKELIVSWGVAAPLMSILLMTLQAVLAPLPAFVITATNGLVFGVFWGTVISWFGAMCGALVSFLLSRLFFDSFARKVLGHKKGMDYLERLSTKYGFKIILTARLLPFISFDLISYAAGLSTIRVRSFVLATGIGMLPATIVYTVFGFEMEKLKDYSQSLFTFSIVSVIVLISIWTIMSTVKRRKSDLNNLHSR